MSNVTKTRVVRIGNSRGIRIPKVWLEQLDLGEEVELSMLADRLVIRSSRRARQGWEEKFRAAAGAGEDSPLEEFPPTAWDLSEWEW